MRPTRPYPYDRWAKLTRMQLAQQRVLRGFWDDRAVTRALDAARVLLGAELDARLGVPGFVAASEARARLAASTAALALRLEPWASAAGRPWWLELALCDAHAIVDRCLGGEGAVLSAPTLLPLDDVGRGTLAYLAARVLAALGGQLQLRDLITSDAAQPELACSVWPIAVQLGPQLLALRLYVPEDVAVPPTARPPARDLCTLPLTLIAHAGVACLPLSAADGLSSGDVVVLDDCSLTLGPLVRGHVQARVPGSGSNLICSVGPTGLTIEAFNRAQESRMTTGRRESDASRAEDLVDVADATIELQLEVARFSLSLAELQQLQIGDVLATGRQIGERVSLRVAGQPFAEGELVDVEGEVGVRVTKLARE